MAHPFLAAIDRRALLADGAIGTLLRDRGVPASACLDAQNLSNPELVLALHQDYVTAGAEIIETNTFGANPLRLKSFGLAEQTAEINAAGVGLAREATHECGHQAFVAGAIGPLGVGTAAGGDVTLKGARKAFAEQARALVDAGVDLIALETFQSLAEAREAVGAVRDASKDVPLVAQLTFQRDYRTWMGEEPAEVAREIHNAGADIVGVNCVPGPQAALEIIEEMARASKVKLIAQPNAGHPRVVEREVSYPVTPAVFADYMPRLVAAGCVVVGGCCGSTPEHTSAMRSALRDGADGETPVAVPERIDVWSHAEEDFAPEEATLREKLAAGRFVVSVGDRPAARAEPSQARSRARAQLKAAGVDCDQHRRQSDGARAHERRSRWRVLFEQRVGIETIIHFTSRDRNLHGDPEPTCSARTRSASAT